MTGFFRECIHEYLRGLVNNIFYHELGVLRHPIYDRPPATPVDGLADEPRTLTEYLSDGCALEKEPDYPLTGMRSASAHKPSKS